MQAPKTPFHQQLLKVVKLPAVRRAVIFIVFLVALCFFYSIYKVIGSALDDGQREWWLIGSILPRSNDLNMPPILDILAEFSKTPRAGGETFGKLIFDGALFTLREAFVGFVIGTLVGMGIAIILMLSKNAEKGVMPYVIASQTVPLVAIAPIIVLWGRSNFEFLPWEWQDWMSVSLIATYLSFFPVTVNGLRGLQSPNPVHLELMHSYGASKRSEFWNLRLPASLPYLFPALRLAGTASVVGAIVGEISAGVRGGLGRLILDFAGKYSTGPERLYISVIGAALLGLFVVGVLALAEKIILNLRGQTSVT